MSVRAYGILRRHGGASNVLVSFKRALLARGAALAVTNRIELDRFVINHVSHVRASPCPPGGFFYSNEGTEP